MRANVESSRCDRVLNQRFVPFGVLLPVSSSGFLVRCNLPPALAATSSSSVAAALLRSAVRFLHGIRVKHL